MKKLIIAFIAIFVSAVATFADDTSCRVYGTDNVATINNPVVYGSSAVVIGKGHFVTVRVELTKKSTGTTSVVVNVSDGNRIVASGVVTIGNGYSIKSEEIPSDAIKEGTTYYLTIARATCQ